MVLAFEVARVRSCRRRLPRLAWLGWRARAAKGGMGRPQGKDFASLASNVFYFVIFFWPGNLGLPTQRNLHESPNLDRYFFLLGRVGIARETRKWRRKESRKSRAPRLTTLGELL